MVSTSRVRKHREAMREAGYHLVQMWVKDTSSPEFIKEARRQARLLRDNPDPELDAWSDDIRKRSLKALDDDEAR
jgi:hypothetical protein